MAGGVRSCPRSHADLLTGRNCPADLRGTIASLIDRQPAWHVGLYQCSHFRADDHL